MNWRYLNLLSGLLIFVCVFLTYGLSYGQSGCGCPLPGQCSPCNGGISKLTLAYHGVIPLTVRVYDNSSMPFIGVVQPGTNFDVIAESGGKFSGTDVYIWIGGSFHHNIPITCGGLSFDPTTNYGWFTIVSAESKDGGTLCCSTNNGANNPPTIFGCPTDIQVVAGSTCSMPVSWIEPQTDQCAIFTSTHSPGTVFSPGTVTVTYTATNSNNKSSTCSFNVTVIDTTKPVLVSGPAPITLNADASCMAVATWTAPTFSDNCTSTPLITSTRVSGSSFILGKTDVTYTAKDVAGNTTQYTFSVTVKDVIPPTVTNCPADVVLTVTGNCKAKASWTPPTFTDACPGMVNVTPSHNPGMDFPVGTTEVTYTAVDLASNVTQCKFNVVVKDQVKPVMSGCPQDITVTTSAPPGAVAVDWSLPTATDECALASLVGSHEPGATFPIGTTTVTYTATDISGNTSVCSFNVTVGWENASLDIVQLLTPDGNTVNDEWVIGNIEKYENNKVIIVDRWGNVIYSATRYDNERNIWKGENGSGHLVPTGTYFYTISIHSGPSVFEKKGFIEVVR
ncbi:MAG TPA: HYR domain-containing protein [Chryseolinea sp.]|nr:HYR domain-containing protein [Chryseolinea sp.]